MDLDLQWLLVIPAAAFALGWLASRLDLRQFRRDSRDAPRAYFEGLNLLLNEQQDKAIDAFIEAVQHDPDTTELHFALGNLFRRRGEFERAVRVHQHLLGRADLKTGDRERAQHALAQDFMKAGLFDRAESAYRALEGTAFDRESRLSLLALYERSRDWRHAIEMASSLERLGQGSFAGRMAHAWCELADEAEAEDRADEVDRALHEARQVAPELARPWLQWGQVLARRGDAAQALAAWDELRQRQPQSFGLVAMDYAKAARDSGRLPQALQALQELFERAPSIDLWRALAVLDGPESPRSAERLLTLTRTRPTLSAAVALLATPPAAPTGGPEPAALQAAREAVTRAARPLQRYRCAACGFEAERWFWQCPGCLGWDSFPPQRVDEL